MYLNVWSKEVVPVHQPWTCRRERSTATCSPCKAKLQTPYPLALRFCPQTAGSQAIRSSHKGYPVFLGYLYALSRSITAQETYPSSEGLQGKLHMRSRFFPLPTGLISTLLVRLLWTCRFILQRRCCISWEWCLLFRYVGCYFFCRSWRQFCFLMFFWRFTGADC